MTIDFKLGRLPSPTDNRDLKAARYLSALPSPPGWVNYTARMADKPWPMFDNDKIGDCAIASTGHHVFAWTLNSRGKAVKLSSTTILRRYEEVSGYVPGDESTDVGCNMRDVLKRWLKEPLGDHHLTAFARIEVPEQISITSMTNFQTSIWVFGGVYLGFDLPVSAQGQIQRGEPWTITSGADAAKGSWGGHAVACLGYSADGVEIITWGRRQLVAWSFLAAYCDEAWGLISADWLKGSFSPDGFNLAQLRTDLASLRAG